METNTLPEPATGRPSLLRRMTDPLVHYAARGVLRALYGFRVRGIDNLDAVKDKPLVVVSNHVSWGDAAAWGVALVHALPSRPRPVFAIDKTIHAGLNRNPVARFLMSRFTVFPIDEKSPQNLKTMTKMVRDGVPLVIFPEGQTQDSGTMGEIFEGAAVIADHAKALIVPGHLKGFEFLRVLTPSLKTYPKRFFPKLTISIGETRKLDIPANLPARKQKALRLEQLKTIMHETPLLSLSDDETLMSALHKAAYNYRMRTKILRDPEGNFSYKQLLRSAYGLEEALRPMTQPGEAVGILLPGGRYAGATFFGLQAGGRVASMIDLQSSAAAIETHAQTLRMNTILTSRRFVEAAKRESDMEILRKTRNIVYLEDLVKEITWPQKIRALLRAHGHNLPQGHESGNAPALIMPTSGSEGPPKGVVLSSKNILANIAQVRSVISFTPADTVFNSNPWSHLYPLNGGFIMPVLSGIPCFQYPNPLDVKNIPRAIYESKATILSGTNKLLSLYAENAIRQGRPGYLSTRLRLVFAGAGRLQRSTYDTYTQQFNICVNQGYGTTELGPAASTNRPGAHRLDTVGRILPGIETRLEPFPGIDGGARLSVRGPNVMLGYMRHDKPGIIQPLEDGWHDTGDVVSFDDDGYMTFITRAKRIIKVGGDDWANMDAIEEAAYTAAPGCDHAVVLSRVPDQEDKLVLFTTDSALTRDRIMEALKAKGEPLNGVPRNADFHVLKEIPKLSGGLGKPNYVALANKLREEFAKAGAGVQQNQPVIVPGMEPALS